MAKGCSKKNKNATLRTAYASYQPKPPKENYIFVVNAWGYISGDWRWERIDAWFEAMCKGEGSGMRPEQYFYQKTHGYLIVKLEKDTSKNISHLFGKHYYHQFLTNHAPHDMQYATIHPYNYEKWGDPGKQQWSEQYSMPMPPGRNVPLRVPYPMPEPTMELPPVDAIKWVRRVDVSVYGRLEERYAAANPDWKRGGPSSQHQTAPADADADAAEALLGSILPGLVKPAAHPTAGKEREDRDIKPAMVVKSEEDRKFKVDSEDVKLPPELMHGSVGQVGSEFKVDPEDVKLPPELMHGSVGPVKSEHVDSRVKVDEDGPDRKPFGLSHLHLPPELKRGSVSVGPTAGEYVKTEQTDAMRVKPEAPENLEDSSMRHEKPTSSMKREEDERATARIKEEQSEYSSGSYKRVKREHLS